MRLPRALGRRRKPDDQPHYSVDGRTRPIPGRRDPVLGTNRLPRLKALVKAVDGIDVLAWRPICDSTYRDDRFDGFGVGVGRWRMDENEALAWVRVRKPPPESDFTRTIRQVQALIGLRERIVESNAFADPLPALEALGVVRTNLPDDVIEGLAALAPGLTDDRVYRRTIQPP